MILKRISGAIFEDRFGNTYDNMIVAPQSCSRDDINMKIVIQFAYYKNLAAYKNGKDPVAVGPRCIYTGTLYNDLIANAKFKDREIKLTNTSGTGTILTLNDFSGVPFSQNWEITSRSAT